jgi:hypothetical protein
MKWLLVITWITIGTGSGIETSTWSSLDECFAVGKRVKQEFESLYIPNTANFSCSPLDLRQ